MALTKEIKGNLDSNSEMKLLAFQEFTLHVYLIQKVVGTAKSHIKEYSTKNKFKRIQILFFLI